MFNKREKQLEAELTKAVNAVRDRDAKIASLRGELSTRDRQLDNALYDLERVKEQLEAKTTHNIVMRRDLHNLNGAVVKKVYSNRKLKALVEDFKNELAQVTVLFNNTLETLEAERTAVAKAIKPKRTRKAK